jgi:hypothetical protein
MILLCFCESDAQCLLNVDLLFVKSNYFNGVEKKINLCYIYKRTELTH